MTLLTVMFEFFKIGLFAIGGGLATIPFLYDLADKYTWFTSETLSDMIAISESTPGPIGINMATYAGYNAGGIFGGFVSTLSLVFPSVVIIIIISHIFNKFKNSKMVQQAFYGIRPTVAALICVATVEIMKVAFVSASKISFLAIGIGIILYILNEKIKMHPVFLILIGAAVGIIFKL